MPTKKKGLAVQRQGMQGNELPKQLLRRQLAKLLAVTAAAEGLGVTDWQNRSSVQICVLDRMFS